VVATARTTTEGTLTTQATIPPYADADDRWVVVVAVTGPDRTKVVSNVFDVTGQPAAELVVENVQVFLVALEQGKQAAVTSWFRSSRRWRRRALP
jgi:hypothetical protein